MTTAARSNALTHARRWWGRSDLGSIWSNRERGVYNCTILVGLYSNSTHGPLHHTQKAECSYPHSAEQKQEADCRKRAETKPRQSIVIANPWYMVKSRHYFCVCVQYTAAEVQQTPWSCVCRAERKTNEALCRQETSTRQPRGGSSKAAWPCEYKPHAHGATSTLFSGLLR